MKCNEGISLEVAISLSYKYIVTGLSKSLSQAGADPALPFDWQV